MNKLKSLLQKFSSDAKATVAVVMGLSMVPVMAVSGAAIDYARAINTGQQLQSALDSATLSGAIIALRNREGRANATFQASMGAPIDGSIATAQFSTIDNPTIGSIYYGQATITIPTTVMKVMGISHITISKKSRAQFGTGDDSCILTLGGELDLDDEATTFNGSPNVNLTGCTIRSNKSIKCNGHSTGATASIAAGNVTNCPNATPGAGIVPDIYAGIASNIVKRCGLLSENVAWTDSETPIGPSVITVSRSGYNEIHVCGNLNLSGVGNLAGTSSSQDTVIVIENGNLNVERHADLVAKRTTFIFTGEDSNGRLTFPSGNGHAAKLAVTSSISTQSPWSGLALYQDPRPSGTISADWGPGATLVVDGINYLPRTDLTLRGNATNGASKCSKLVSYAFRINGGVSLKQDASGCTSQQVNQFHAHPRLLL